MKKQHQTLSSVLFIFLCFLMASIQSSYGQNLTVTTAITQNACDHDGIVTATVTGGTAPYTYSWYSSWQNPPLITSSNVFTNYSGAGYISLYVSDANGTQGYGYVQPNGVPFLVDLDWNNCSSAHCPLNDGQLAVIVTGGTAPFSYVWYDNGVIIGTTTTPSISNLAPSMNYDIEITDANGCKLFYHDISDSLAVGSINNIQANSSITPANCLNGTAQVNPSGGTAPYTYSWYESYPNNQALSSTTNSVSNLVAFHQYNVTITDVDGCMITQYLYANSTASFSTTQNITPATCLNSNGAVTLNINPQTGASLAPPYNYSWSNSTAGNSPSLQNVPGGSYFCHITDANGCEYTAYPTIPINTPIVMNLSTTPTTSCLTPNGTATVAPTGGQTPYVYSWSTGQTTASISGLNVNTFYSIHVTDANGCVQQQSSPVSYANAGTYQLTNITPDICNAGNGSATATVVVGGVSPFSYAWGNGQITQTATNLSSGYTPCTVIDANGCQMALDYNSWTNYYIPAYSPIVISGTTTNASCLYTADGSITVSATGGTPPYQYNWSNGQTTATLSNILTGMYYLQVSDAAGCVSWKSFNVGYNGIANCTGKIKGYVYKDLNLNCVQDPGEGGIEGVLVSCSPFAGSAFTNGQGYYEFTVPLGTYNVNHYPLQYYTANCPTGTQTVNMLAAGMTIWANFADEVIPAKDLQISVYHLTPPIPGNSYTQVVKMKNVGTLPIASPLLHTYTDAALNLNMPLGFVLNSPNYYTKSYLNFNAGSLTTQNLTYSVPVATPLGNTLIFTDSIAPTGSGEVSPWNNVKYFSDVVVGSYDPNYKEVFPKGKGAPGFITPHDSILEYVIHFQNTGNYPATTVVLKDTIDTDLDWTTIQMGYGTHAYTTKISADNVLEITFDNINLADSFSNPEASMGFVAFTIKQKKGLTDGTKFTNAADIYFDFNYPIHTNTVLNTLSGTTAMEDITENNLSLKVYPNPTADKLNVEVPAEWKGKELTVRCMDIMGKEVVTKWEANQDKMTLNTAHLSMGWYLLQVSDGQTLLTQKFGVVK